MLLAAEVFYRDRVQGGVRCVLDPDNEHLLENGAFFFEKVRTSS